MAMDTVLRADLPVRAVNGAGRDRGSCPARDRKQMGSANPCATSLLVAWLHRHADPALGRYPEALRHGFHNDARRSRCRDGTDFNLHPTRWLSCLRPWSSLCAGTPAARSHHPSSPPLHSLLLPGDPVMSSRLAGRLLHGFGLLLTFAIVIFPFYWMVTSSFKTQ